MSTADKPLSEIQEAEAWEPMAESEIIDVEIQTTGLDRRWFEDDRQVHLPVTIASQSGTRKTLCTRVDHLAEIIDNIQGRGEFAEIRDAQDQLCILNPEGLELA